MPVDGHSELNDEVNDESSSKPSGWSTRERTERQTGATDREQVGRLYERYAPHITAYALRRADSSDAADVVAETFLVAWRRYDSVPVEPKTLPWLYGVARRVLANQRRSARRRSQLRDRLSQELNSYSTPSTDRDAERLSQVESALVRLPADDAEILRLTAWEELTPSEIAVVVGVAPGTVRQRLRRARIRLRRQLAADDTASPGKTPGHATSPKNAASPPTHHPSNAVGSVALAPTDGRWKGPRYD